MGCLIKWSDHLKTGQKCLKSLIFRFQMFGIQMVTIFVTKVWPEVLAIWTMIYSRFSRSFTARGYMLWMRLWWMSRVETKLWHGYLKILAEQFTFCLKHLNDGQLSISSGTWKTGDIYFLNEDSFSRLTKIIVLLLDAHSLCQSIGIPNQKVT